jgi:glucose-1-phosphate thymidylyltransferase
MKAVVLARGKGTRMQRGDRSASMDPAQAEMADRGLKAMIPFRRPFLDYVLSALADAGCIEVCLVIGPEHDVVREYYGRTRPPRRIRLAFAVQDVARGTADAILAAEPFTGEAPFLALNADNYYPADVLRALVALDGPGLPVFRRSVLIERSNIDAERIRSYAVLTIAENGDLVDIVEKPDASVLEAFGDDFFVSMNCWRLGPSIFTACRRIEPSTRGEIELPNAVRYAVKHMGERFRTIPVEAGVLDLSHRADIAEVDRRLRAIDPQP